MLNKILIQGLDNNHKIYASILLALLLYCFSLFVQRSVSNWYHHYYITYVSLLKFEKKIKKRLFQVCDRMKVDDYNNPEIENGTIRAKNASINIFRVFQAYVEMAAAILGTVFMGAVLSFSNYRLTIIIILLSLASIIENIFLIIQNKLLLYKNTQLEKEEEEYSKLILNAKSFKEIYLSGCFEFVLNKWGYVIKKKQLLETKKSYKSLFLSLIIKVFTLGCLIIAYGMLYYSFLNDSISIAEFSVSITAFHAVNSLMKNFFEVLADISQYLMMVKPYFDFEVLASSHDNNSGDNDKTPHQKDISVIKMENIFYKYYGSKSYALENINLNIGQGQTVAIVGENGSGKTTLLKVLLKLFAPSHGTILYNNGFTSDQLFFEIVSIVPQNFNSYAISIRDNITFGRKIDDKKIKELLGSLNLEFLNPSDIYGREFGGIELSGGQKQRIAILRAKYKNGNLYAFDEPTSAIDPLQEKMIYDSLIKTTKGKTTIIISHRLALTRLCDLIVVLKEGKIIEKGTHDELMKMNSEYAAMWKSQAELYLA